MARIWITVDVEAQPNRAAEDHVDRLIWGKFGSQPFGIGMMMDIGDAHGVGITMFTDLAELDRYRGSFRDVAETIHQRKHDLQLHVHAEFFRPEIWSAADVKPISDLNAVSAAQASCIVAELTRRYIDIAHKRPSAFRGGGYRFNQALLRALSDAGVSIDSSVNRSRSTQPYKLEPCPLFFWPNGTLEIPISVVDGFRNIPRPFDFNFNSAHFPSYVDMIAFVEHFEKQFGPNAVIVLVMHSWSFLDISPEYFGPPIEAHAERLERFIAFAREHHDFVTTADLEPMLKADYLPRMRQIEQGSRSIQWQIDRSEPASKRRAIVDTNGDAPFWRPGRLSPLEEFGYPWHTSAEFRPAMEAMLTGRWEKGGRFITDMRPPINFDDQGRPDACDLHSWEPAGYALRAAEVFEDKRYFELAKEFALDWLERYWRPHAERTSPQELDELLADTSTFAWYDMAVGRRIFRLAYLIDVLAREQAATHATLDELWRALQFHHATLGRDRFFRSHSNHGIHQALGQLAAANRFFQRPESAPQYALARERLSEVVDAHFGEDGVHREHSPGYHYGLMTTFMGVMAGGLVQDGKLLRRFGAMETALKWMIGPNGRITAFGDTDPKRMARSIEFARQFADPELQHQLSGGLIGKAPELGVTLFPETGYAFARLAASNGEPSYLAQMAAFHSNIHKHADHLTFAWHDSGRDILIDPGRYAYAGKTKPGSDLFEQGFWYSDPKRIYVESTRAHNCVEIDDRSYPRRNVKPWGSALRYAGEQNGLAVTDCDVTHLRSIRHRRVLVMGPGHFLLVLDWLNDRLSTHDYRQWFQLAPEWDVRREEDCLIASSKPAGSTDETLSIFNLIEDNVLAAPIRGQEEPRLQGWMSDAAYSLKPITSLAIEATKRGMGRFATLFVFGEGVEVDRGMTRFNATLRAGQVGWSDAKGRHRLHIALGEPGSVQAGLSANSGD